MRESPPAIWAEMMRSAGIGDPRNGQPSYQALARSAGIGAETVRKAILGLSEPSQDTLQKMADALRVADVRVLTRLIGQAREVQAPYTAPDDAHLLHDDERIAIAQLITVMTKGRRQVRHDRIEDASAEILEHPGLHKLIRAALPDEDQ